MIDNNIDKLLEVINNINEISTNILKSQNNTLNTKSEITNIENKNNNSIKAELKNPNKTKYYERILLEKVKLTPETEENEENENSKTNIDKNSNFTRKSIFIFLIF